MIEFISSPEFISGVIVGLIVGIIITVVIGGVLANKNIPHY